MKHDRIDAELVESLVAEQFPQWRDLPVVPVAKQGWDNRTFRLGDALSVRLPSAEHYVQSVEKEQTWLPRLAPHLPLPIPEPVAMGRPSQRYPWPWSVRRWLDGRPVSPETVGGDVRFARDLAEFLTALQRAPVPGGPVGGAHNFHRGCPLPVYDDETRTALAVLGDRAHPHAEAVWDAACAAPWRGDPVWFHGDVAAGNLLADPTGRLCAVIDFGTSGVGDPACDLVAAWTLLRGPSRAAFQALVPADAAMWARARGWLLWKCLITLADAAVDPAVATAARRDVDAVVAEWRAAGNGTA